MTNPLQEAIIDIMRQSAEFKKLERIAPSTVAKITRIKGLNADIEFNNPYNGTLIGVKDCEMAKTPGMKGGIKVGDTVVVSFPDGNYKYPIVISVIRSEIDLIAGSYTQKSMGG